MSSRYFLKRSKIDISQNVKFLSGYFDRSRSDQEGMPISRFVARHVRLIRGGLFLGVAGLPRAAERVLRSWDPSLKHPSDPGLDQFELLQFSPACFAKGAQRIDRVAIHHLVQFS